MMPWRREKGKRTVFLCAAAWVILLAVCTAWAADYYYALNDDVMMKDILAGVQTGTPTGYNIQMLYPISAFLAFFYRQWRSVPWYGIFLCVCQYGCLFLIVRRCLNLWDGRAEGCSGERPAAWKQRAGRAAILVMAGTAVTALFWMELVYVQYTVTCGLLAGTAVFLLYTTPEGLPAAAFFGWNAASIVCVVLAFFIRTEMLLLMLPFIGAVGLMRWIRAGKGEKCRYPAVIACIAVCMAGGYLIHTAAYGDPAWQEFLRFFDARTEVYDFYGVPSYEEHAAFYESIGMSRASQALLENYNFGLDASVDAEKMEQIAAYAGKVYYAERSWKDEVKRALWEYVHRMLPLPGDTIGAFAADMPWNVTVLMLYAALVVTGILEKRKELFWQIPFLGISRTVSWGYVLFRGRVPERISHPLYLTEMLALLALLTAWHVRKEEGFWKSAVLPGLLVLFLAGNIPFVYHKIQEEGVKRQTVNQAYEELQAYCRENAENYYYVDVRSTVDFSEKMFEKVDNSGRNYDIIGGWACKSPVSPMRETAFFISAKGKDITWLSAWLEEQGGEAGVLAAEEDTLQHWDIYRLPQKGVQ